MNPRGVALAALVALAGCTRVATSIGGKPGPEAGLLRGTPELLHRDIQRVVQRRRSMGLRLTHGVLEHTLHRGQALTRLDLFRFLLGRCLRPSRDRHQQDARGDSRRDPPQPSSHPPFHRACPLMRVLPAAPMRYAPTVAARRSCGHCQEVEHRGIRATAVKDVACKYGEPARAHGVHKVALAAERLSHGGYAREQRLVLE